MNIKRLGGISSGRRAASIISACFAALMLSSCAGTENGGSVAPENAETANTADCEFAPFDELCAQSTKRFLSRRGIVKNSTK